MKFMPKRFSDQVILITGAGSGLGRSTAVELAKEGAKLSLVDLSIEYLLETKRVILESAPEVEILLLDADVSKEELVKKFVNETVNRFGNIHGFFNNAGIAEEVSILDEYDSGSFLRVIEINLFGVFYGMKYVLPIMKEQKIGTIVNTSSVAGIRGVYGRAGYVASKHGVIGLTKTAASEYGKYGICINAIAPGSINTNMTKTSFKNRNPENWEAVAKKYAEDIPAGRLGEPEDVSKLVSFLLSENAQFINGVVIPIDGGQTSKFR
jgi:NAD(P)-dependent dehydrogenase (short-subunit alcohol dehydrogenase family)